jgi:hypothetical protein
MRVNTVCAVPPNRHTSVSNGDMEKLRDFPPRLSVITIKIAEILVNDCHVTIAASIGQHNVLQYAIFLSTDIKQKIIANTLKLKGRVTAAATLYPKWIAEMKFPTFINRRTVVPLIAET